MVVESSTTIHRHLGWVACNVNGVFCFAGGTDLILISQVGIFALLLAKSIIYGCSFNQINKLKKIKHRKIKMKKKK